MNQPMYDRRGRLANFVPELGKIVIASHEALPDMDQVIQQSGMAEMVIYAPDGRVAALADLYELEHAGATLRFGLASPGEHEDGPYAAAMVSSMPDRWQTTSVPIWQTSSRSARTRHLTV